ncbi:MAG: insulinase family protein [Armatimonadetes bacterium]|nr:insulinase family protein [Armatimonadota bacterium]
MKKELEGFGGKINAQTNKDFTHYYVNLPSFHYKEALEIIIDALINNNFNPQELERERAVVLNEYKIGLEDPFNQIIQILYDYHFKNHPYKLPVIGTELSLKNLSGEDFINYKEKYYTPNNVFLVILGDFEEEELKKYLENLIINFKETNKINYQNLTNEPLKENLTEIIEEKDLSFGILALGFNVVSVKNQDVYAIDILTFLLGQGDGAYLNKNLVEDKKIFDQINVDFTTSRDPGILIILGSFTKTDIPKIKTSLFEEIEKIKKGDFKEEDFKRAKNLLINNFTFSTETLSGRSETLGFYEAIDNFQFAQNYLDEIEKITKEKIIKAAQKYLNFNNATLIIHKPKK